MLNRELKDRETTFCVAGFIILTGKKLSLGCTRNFHRFYLSPLSVSWTEKN